MNGLADLVNRHLAGCPPNQQWIDWFRRHGVSAAVLAFSPAGHVDMLLGHRFAWGQDGSTFVFDDEGESALTFPVRNRLGELQDVVAWQPKTGRVATLLNCAGMIGADQLNAPRLGDGLQVCEMPMGWLQAGRQGVVILDPKQALPQLLDVGPLLAANFEHGGRLGELFEAALPVGLVPKESEAAA